ncbi:hypothetical protein HYW84_00640 [Candidatus Peregrinibacteria bacterium]|nr:hypothetical protein [Candidatus Peregrinibacteria bacterium]
MRRIFALPLVVIIGVILVAACEKPDTPLPVGIQTVHGYLQPVPFSLKRRGTHALYSGSGGEMMAYAEGIVVNLRQIERQDVEVEGVFEKNIVRDDLPVFVVQRVLHAANEQMRRWTIPALGLSVALPKSWKGGIKGGSAMFTASGSSVPVLTITVRKAPPAAPENPLYGPLAAGNPGELMTVGSRKATAVVSVADQTWTARVAPAPSGKSETIFSFALQSSLKIELQQPLFRNILKTVEFNSAALQTLQSESSVSGAADSRASGEGAACGGVAGILCPKGQFCKITDSIGESGVCTKR